jgi:hypothetical protein
MLSTKVKPSMARPVNCTPILPSSSIPPSTPLLLPSLPASTHSFLPPYFPPSFPPSLPPSLLPSLPPSPCPSLRPSLHPSLPPSLLPPSPSLSPFLLLPPSLPPSLNLPAGQWFICHTSVEVPGGGYRSMNVGSFSTSPCAGGETSAGWAQHQGATGRLLSTFRPAVQ